MNRKINTVIAAAALAFAASLPATSEASTFPPADSQGHQLPTLAPMIQKVVPSVVNIFTRSKVPVQQNPLFSDPFFRRFFNVPNAAPRERFVQSLGSGVVVDADHGYILTNNHVVEHAVSISVRLSDGRLLDGKLVGADPETDIAVIKVKAKGLTALPIADSDTLRVGDFVVAVGNPFGLSKTVTSGIVSALGRSGLGIEGYEDFIQTDASINPGNSGGALVNLRGQMVGVNTAILSKSGGNVGIGFAIPINMARDVMQQLIKYGEVRRGQLGVQAQDLTGDLATAFGLKHQGGAVITDVEAGTPAAKAGLQSGDVITEVNGQKVSNAADVRTAVGLLRVGQEVKLTVLRGGTTRTVVARVEEPRTSNVEGGRVNKHLTGATLRDIVEGTPWYGKVKGVGIAKVEPGSPAWQAGLRDGDVITQANRAPVNDIASLRKAVTGSDTLLLNIRRGDGAFFVLIQ